MNRPGAALLLALAMRGLACAAPDSDDPFASSGPHAGVYGEGRRWQSRFVVEVFEMPSAEAHDLVVLPIKAKELRELVSKHSATTLAKLMVLTSTDGHLASVEQVDHYEYPTEFDPPQLPQALVLVDPGPGAAKDETPTPASAVKSPFNGGLGVLTTTTATAFETAFLGDKLELDAAPIEGAKGINCTCTLESKELVAEPMNGDIPTALFAVRKKKPQVRLIEGEPAFLGTHSVLHRPGTPKEQGGARTTLSFITVRRESLPPATGGDQEPFRKVYPSVRITLEAISLMKPAAHALMSESLDDSTLHDRLTKLIDQQQARREIVLATRVIPGSKASVSNADELMRPTEFDPPQMPMQLIIANHQLLQDLRSGRQDGVGAQPPVNGGNANGGFGLLTTLSPTAFQMESLGERAEFDLVQTGDEFSITLSADLQRQAGDILYNGVGHAVIESQRINTSVNARPNVPVLLGTLSKPLNTGCTGSNTEDRVWLAFLRVGTK